MPKYDIILADPPWEYKSWSDKGTGRSASQHYKVQDLNWIKCMPVQKISNPSSILLLWVTMPLLPAGLEVIQSWGFTYKTNAFTWVKLNKKSPGYFVGNGYYTRSNAELCLLATKGQIVTVQDHSIRSVIETEIFNEVIKTPRTEHSSKPEEAQDRIEGLFGLETSKIELFARRVRPGWKCLGNDIDGLDIYDAIAQEAERIPTLRIKRRKQNGRS